MSKKTIGVILSGCGYLDGAEITESVLTLLALDGAGVTYRVFAPDVDLDEVDHLTGKPTGKKRNVLSESARIARGEVENLADVQGTDVDGWVLPGGFGAAKNLSDFASAGDGAVVNKEVARVIREALAAHLPIGACCIAPAVLAATTKGSGPKLTLTIGDDEGTAKALSNMGATHENAPVEDAVVDASHKVVTAPAYMDGEASISQVGAGIEKMVKQVVDWA
jgi:enhancing lycopene biosynthesis protein 2